MDIEKNILAAFKKADKDTLKADIEEIKEHVHKTRWRSHETSAMFNLHNKYTSIVEYGQHCPPCRAKVQRRCKLVVELYDTHYGEGEEK